MIDCENMINAAKACLVLTEPIKVTLRAWVMYAPKVKSRDAVAVLCATQQDAERLVASYQNGKVYEINHEIEVDN